MKMAGKNICNFSPPPPPSLSFFPFFFLSLFKLRGPSWGGGGAQAPQAPSPQPPPLGAPPGAVISRLEWYGMTFWTKLQHELYVLKTRYLIQRETVKEGIPVIEPWCDKCMYNLFSSTFIQVFPYSANISDMKWRYGNMTVLLSVTELI